MQAEKIRHLPLSVPMTLHRLFYFLIPPLPLPEDPLAKILPSEMGDALYFCSFFRNGFCGKMGRSQKLPNILPSDLPDMLAFQGKRGVIQGFVTSGLRATPVQNIQGGGRLILTIHYTLSNGATVTHCKDGHPPF